MARRVVIPVINDFKGATAQAWYDSNPILRQDEPGWERDTGKLKIGTGIDPWRDLPYVGDSDGSGGGDDFVTEEELQDHIESPTPHTIYDEGPSLVLRYENAKV